MASRRPFSAPRLDPPPQLPSFMVLDGFSRYAAAAAAARRPVLPPVPPMPRAPVWPLQTPPLAQTRAASAAKSARRCSNCAATTTRQWVRGENQSWLCHSCGQFWRKNGHPRPKALWNRPTFRRSSRKIKSLPIRTDSIKKPRYPNQTTTSVIASSFVSGKKLVLCDALLPSMRQMRADAALQPSRAPHSSSFVPLPQTAAQMQSSVRTERGFALGVKLPPIAQHIAAGIIGSTVNDSKE